MGVRNRIIVVFVVYVRIGLAACRRVYNERKKRFCAKCNKKFLGEPEEIHCSQKCRTSYKRGVKRCLNCDKEFIDYRDSVFHCSNECRKITSDMPNCAKCGKSLPDRNRIHCSRVCAKPIIQPKICPICEKSFNPSGNHKNVRCCSRTCGAKLRENRHHLTDDERRFVYLSRSIMGNLRNKLKPKVCSNCGYNKHAEICHVFDLSSARKAGWTLEEANSLSNLILLCSNCHGEYDRGELSIVGLVKLDGISVSETVH